jgi:periplasmic divalent cation tolerance protein
MNTDMGMVMTTFSDPETGRSLAEGLLEQRLAACVQTMAIQSTYRWKGAIQREPETLMLIKTRTSLYARVEAFIRKTHDYEIPEIIQVPITAGLPAYLSWIDGETSDHG